MSSVALEPALVAITDILEKLHLRYALVGGLAVGAWGVSRATKDIDIYTDLGSHIRSNLCNEMRFVDFDVPAMEEELERFGVFRALYRPTNVFVDIFDAQNPLGEAILHRRREICVFGKVMWTAAAEDLMVLKAFSDRPRDFEDLTKLIAVGLSDIDVAYVDNWVRELDRSIGGDEVSERIRLARGEAVKRVRKKRY